jgi:asparagine synthase (glutamine-hydrolysing)
VVYNGDGSDELVMGYLYFHKAPSGEEAQDETIRLLEEIHKYDVLRVDRTISHHGLEARVPFLDRDFVNYYKSILPRLKVPTNGVEKYLLRSSFEDGDLLPNSVLWRKKEALSDGVSSTEKSWHHILQDHIETIVSDEEFEGMRGNYIHNPPMTKEAYYYRKVFGELFGEEHNGVIPHYWLPKWCGEGIVDPSARVLSVY